MMEVHVTTDIDSGLTVVRNNNNMQLEDGSIAQFFDQSKPTTGCISGEMMQTIELNNGEMTYLCENDNSNLQTFQSKNNVTNQEKVMLIPVTFSSQQPLHLKEIKGKTMPVFSCDEKNCEKVYSTAQHLKVHKRSHTGEKPFQCKWTNCNKMFTTCYALKAHSRVHTGEKPFPCPQADCKKAFKTSSDLQKHIRTHTGEKPFKCPFPNCGKAFTTSDICKVHIRTHTGERPHKCPFANCEKSFSNYTNYKNHIRTHTGEKPYVCMVKDCGKRFAEYSSLYKHQIVHSVQKPYKCSLCNKSYRQVSTLVHHKKRVHNEYNNTNAPLEKQSKNENNVASSSIIMNPSSKEGPNKDPYDSTLVLLPVESFDSNCFVVNDSSNSQLSLLPPTENQNKFQLVTSPVNNDALVVTLSGDSPGLFSNDTVQAETSTPLVIPNDDGLMYINKQTLASPAAASTVTGINGVSSQDCHSDLSNPPDVWLNCSESSADGPSKQADVQFSLGTVYVLQVVPNQVGLKSPGDCDSRTEHAMKDDKKDENKYFTSNFDRKTASSVHVQSPSFSTVVQPAVTQSTVTSPTKRRAELVSDLNPSKCVTTTKPISFPSAKRRITVKLPRKLTTLSKSLASKAESKKRFLLPKLHDLQP